MKLIQDIINYSWIIVDVNPELDFFLKLLRGPYHSFGGGRVGLKFLNLHQVIRGILVETDH